MSKSINQSQNYGRQISYEQAKEVLNDLTGDQQGLLLDCSFSHEKLGPSQEIAKPLPFLQAVNLEEEFMIIILEYKLYLPEDSEERELALKIQKEDCKVYKEEERLNFIFEEKELISIQLHNSFEFPYYLNQDAVLPTYSFLNWVASPFI